MAGRLVPTQHEPIVPTLDGRPPGFVVACLDCAFATDVHALSADDAVVAVAPHHERAHHLVARAVSYTDSYVDDLGNRGPHPLYR